jgi:hypothetical protein
MLLAASLSMVTKNPQITLFDTFSSLVSASFAAGDKSIAYLTQ